MDTLLNFAGEHPVLAFLLAVVVANVATAPFRYGFKAYNRSLRARNIAARGWPANPLMDADGDIVHPDKAD